MDRYTKQYGNGNWTLDTSKFPPIDQNALDSEIRNSEPIRAAVERLAEYEDAEEKGLLVHLPCKVGDTVYVWCNCDFVCMTRDGDTGITECPFETDCDIEECDGKNVRLFRTSVDCIFNNGYGWQMTTRGIGIELDICDFGKTVFLTPEAAQQALKARKKRLCAK